MYVHMTYLPFIRAAGELKTKPSQQSVAKLREIGTSPTPSSAPKRPSARTCAASSRSSATSPSTVIEEIDVRHTIYEVPLVLAEQGLDEIILVHFRLARPGPSSAPGKPWSKPSSARRHRQDRRRRQVFRTARRLQIPA
jgi:CTP synthase